MSPLGLHESFAAELRVGPGERFATIAAAAREARDGDSVVIMAGEYVGDVAVWTQRRLSIAALPPGAVLRANGEIAEGKAIWVIRNGDFEIRNIHFTGARAKAGNGAGIRFEAGHLTISHCRFSDNQMGLLTGNEPSSRLTIEDTYFHDAPAQWHSLPHLLYVGSIDRFNMQGSRLEGGFRGHLVKSRARETILRYNWIVDRQDGRASYEVDLPNGGDALLLGNVIGQSASSANQALISFGTEGFRWPVNRLRLSHNTLTSLMGAQSDVLRTEVDAWPSGTRLETWGNLMLGGGRVPEEFERLQSKNRRGAWSLPSNSPSLAQLRSQAASVSPVPASRDPEMTPDAQFKWPLGRTVLPSRGVLHAGALQ